MARANKVGRPLGISILAILEMAGGVIAIIGGILAGVAMSSIIGTLGPLVGVISVIAGLVAFAAGYGFWTGAKWSWWLAIVLYALGIISSLASLAVGAVFSVIGLVVDVLLIYYLNRPGVKSWFNV